METIASYWEPQIRTYGFRVVTGLSLVDIFLGSERLGEWGDKIQTLKNDSVDFELVVIQLFSEEGFHVYLLMEECEVRAFLERFRLLFSEEKEDAVSVTSHVEMIHFQGPHFGDRYGIADTVFNALSKGDIPILAASCTGASIYLVLPQKTSKKAKALLEEGFEIPKRSGVRWPPIRMRAGVENEP